jgi:hypothetical protein
LGGVREVAIIEIEEFYPYACEFKSRYGTECPPHPLIEAILAKGIFKYELILRKFARFREDFLQISSHYDVSQPFAPCWLNGFFQGLDAIALYGMISSNQPRLFFEIGSGNSTKFAAAAKNKHSHHTSIISIDPEPRTEIDHICDDVIRKPIQECDMALFHDLQPGDILFVDGSHRLLQSSDVSIFFLEILPRIKPGVLIHLHDIFWPSDYPNEWAKRMYSEQYVLGALLLYAENIIDVILPNAYISQLVGLTSILCDVWDSPSLEGSDPNGVSFWFTKRQQ